RLLVIIASALMLVVVIAVAVAFNSSFQTWMVRKMIASNPALHATIGSVSAGMNHVQLKNVRFEQPGAVLTAPVVDIDLSLFSAPWEKKVFVSRLVATGWRLEFTNTKPEPGRTSPARIPSSVGESKTATPVSAPSAAGAFAGIFSQLALPFDLTLDAMKLD